MRGDYGERGDLIPHRGAKASFFYRTNVLAAPLWITCTTHKHRDGVPTWTINDLFSLRYRDKSSFPVPAFPEEALVDKD